MLKNVFSPQPNLKRKGNYIQALDGIRGFAFLLVLLAHFSNHYDFMFKGVGRVGVWLFFVLSAFLLASYFLDKPEKLYSKFEWANYSFRRAMRILPLYFSVVILYSLYGYLVESPESLLRHLLILEGNGHFWTIPAELKYYLTLPFVIFVIIALFRRNIGLTLISLAAVIAVYLFMLPSMLDVLNEISLLLYLPVFLCGSVMALIHLKLKESNYINPILFNIGTVLITIILIVTIPSVWSYLFYEVESNHFYNHNAEFGIILAILLLCILNGSKSVRRFFESRILVFFGNISFSGYLIHPIILYSVRTNLSEYLPTAALVLLSLFLIIVSSIILHVLIERPSMKMRLRKREQIAKVH